MDAANVSTAVLSLTTPGVWFGDPVAARRTARQVNEYAAGLARTYPGRFGLFAVLPLPDVTPLITEIPQDTARAITNLLFTGTFSCYRDIRFIFTHAGGNMPMMVGRMKQYGPASLATLAPLGIEQELRRHYFDLAGTANKPAVAAITSIVPTSQILMGSDNPFIPLAETARDLLSLGLSAADLRAIRRDNALALLPGLAVR